MKILQLAPRALVALLLACALPRARSQGGPPMITDDPGTPGNGNWEINTAWVEQVVPGGSMAQLPQLDANYGVGDRIQLNYQSSWNIVQRSGGASSDGLAQSQVAVKWRYYDAGDSGLQLSMYPRLTFLNPGSSADRRGVTDGATSFLLPLELVKDLGPVSLDLDFGHTFSGDSTLRGWMGGICLGHEVRKGWEVDAELHATTSEDTASRELVLNVGTRLDLSSHTTLLAAVGRDLSDSLGPRTSLLLYLGLQLRL